jgi:hypothetical protein
MLSEPDTHHYPCADLCGCSLLPPQHMPWTLKGGSKCDLFDYACAAKERAAKAAME